jgi:hypothetical protein
VIGIVGTGNLAGVHDDAQQLEIAWQAAIGQQRDKTAGSTYFGLGRHSDAHSGSELGYAHR